MKDCRTEQTGDGTKINRIPLDGEIYDLYAAPSASGASRAAILKSIRIVNTHSAPVVINLYYTDNVLTSGGGTSPTECRRRRLAPSNMVLASGFAFIEDSEITVESGARIQASAKPETGAVQPSVLIDYVIGGVERDVS